jgi:hypothetical protein
MKTAKKLRQFRRACEKETQHSANQIHVPLMDVLNDICRVLNLPRTQRRQVLGRRGVARYTNDRQWSATLICNDPKKS